MKQASRAVHAGRGGKAGSGSHQSGIPLAPDLSPAAVHVYTELDDYDAVARGDRPGHYYGRNSNSNRTMLEEAVAELEGPEAAEAPPPPKPSRHPANLAPPRRPGHPPGPFRRRPPADHREGAGGGGAGLGGPGGGGGPASRRASPGPPNPGVGPPLRDAVPPPASAPSSSATASSSIVRLLF